MTGDPSRRHFDERNGSSGRTAYEAAEAAEAFFSRVGIERRHHPFRVERIMMRDRPRDHDFQAARGLDVAAIATHPGAGPLQGGRDLSAQRHAAHPPTGTASTRASGGLYAYITTSCE